MFSVLRLLRFLPLALVVGPAAWALDPKIPVSCRISIHSLPEVRRALETEIDQLEESLGQLALPAEGIKPLRRLGFGFSGTVFEVTYQGQVYALKIFSRVDAQETGEAVLIQKALGELGMAPRVIGVLPAKDAQLWARTHRGPSFGKALFGLLMERVEVRTLKTSGRFSNRPDPLSSAKRANLKAQAQALSAKLDRLGIAPDDIDAVITADNELILVDLAMFRFHRDLYRFMPGRGLDRLLAWIDALP